jgi:hypothetical protein
MARLTNNILGPVVGKIGPVVGSSWKGIPYIKSRYKKRTVHISDNEKNNRHKFALAHAWLKPLQPFVRQGFKGYTPTVEGFLAAKSFLLKNAMEGEGQDIAVNPALMQVSFGGLPLAKNITAKLIAPGQLQFSWDTSTVEGSSNRDQVMMLAYNVNLKHAEYIIRGEFRFKGADMLRLHTGTGTYLLYLAFVAADRSSQSHSVYLGEITV